MTPEEQLGKIMGQQDAFATLLARLMIKYGSNYSKDVEEKRATEEQKKSA